MPSLTGCVYAELQAQTEPLACSKHTQQLTSVNPAFHTVPVQGQAAQGHFCLKSLAYASSRLRCALALRWCASIGHLCRVIWQLLQAKRLHPSLDTVRKCASQGKPVSLLVSYFACTAAENLVLDCARAILFHQGRGLMAWMIREQHWHMLHSKCSCSLEYTSFKIEKSLYHPHIHAHACAQALVPSAAV